MKKFAVASYNNFEGELSQEIIEANDKLDALMKSKLVAPYASDYESDDMSYDDMIATHFSEDIQINVIEI
jgi:hypothetical protein